VRFKEILSCLTGLSCPVFGISWNPPEMHTAIARRVIAFLEDRRVLYVPSEMEVPHHGVQSVLEIRHLLTSELQSLEAGTELADSLRAMRAACRKCMNTVGARSEIIVFGAHLGHWASWEFNGALGELRAVFGVHLVRLAAAYGLDVEGDLSTILPASDSEAEQESAER
jgi:hypothetical protein